MRNTLAVLLTAVTLYTTGCSLLLPEGVGAPIGASARAGDYIATIIRTEEPRMPSLHHRPENDRYRISLLLHSLDGKTRRMVPIAGGLRFSDFAHAARILGDDGRLLWFHAHEPMAYDYRANKLINQADLPKSGEPRRPFGFSDPPITQFLSPTDRYGTEYKKPALLRGAAGADPLRLSAPTSVLLTYWSKRGIFGTFTLARTTESGQQIWTADTDLQDVDQILPHPRYTALIGKLRPKVPDEVRGPTLVIIDNQSGAVYSESLWIRR